MYKVVIEQQVWDFLRKIPKADVQHFKEKLCIIAENPYGDIPFAKRLKGTDSFRFRFGDYRAVYTVLNSLLTVCVIDAAHRKDIYRR